MKKNKLHIGYLIYSAGLMIIILASCKRYVDPPPYFEEPGDTSKPASRRILFIGIDGAVPAEYKKMTLPALQGMLVKSKYSWDAVSDELSTDAASWKTLMTGVSYSRHKIKDSTFIYTQGINDPQHGAIPNFPSVFSYILSSPRNDMRTVFISPWPAMVEKLVPEVQDPVIALNDLAVKDSAIKRIKNGNPDFMVVHFNSVAIAGKAGGFNEGNNDYKNAAVQVDGYINEMMMALKARPGYNKNEEWLVVVTSTHGGVGNNYGGFSPQETTVFSVYYNEAFKQTEFTKQGSFVNVQLKGGQGGVRAVMSDASAYNPGTGPMTIEMKIKGSRSGGFPLFVSKKGPASGNILDSGDPGFAYFSGGNNNWNLQLRGASGNVRIQPGLPQSPAVVDNSWHTLTLVFVDSASKRWVKRYRDAVKIDETDISSFGTIVSPQPLILGWSQGNAGDALTSHVAYNVSDIKIFDVGLSSADVAANICVKDITQHTKYANLTGYWPCTDGLGGRFKNYAPGAVNKDFILQSSFEWKPVPEFPCSFSSVVDAGKTNLFLTNSGFATTVFYWLKLNTQAAWGLEGSKWLEPYEQEFVKL
ncbi:alkaline phosphatase family protein [Lacibacter sp. H375]|uniref:alkaline phosphatase family protein n=1 Tax=Lacibacter sp. H375 TaxID=3133424 RepID=UPI0030C31A4A